MEKKLDSYGNTLYRVTPLKRGLPLGWFKSEEEAQKAHDAHTSLINGNKVN